MLILIVLCPGGCLVSLHINEKIFYGGLAIIVLGGLTTSLLIFVGLVVAAIGAYLHDSAKT